MLDTIGRSHCTNGMCGQGSEKMSRMQEKIADSLLTLRYGQDPMLGRAHVDWYSLNRQCSK
jgi:hypothetical protein